MNPDNFTAPVLRLLLLSGVLLAAGFLMHALWHCASAARRELLWRTVFLLTGLLPLTLFFRPWGLLPAEVAPIPAAVSTNIPAAAPLPVTVSAAQNSSPAVAPPAFSLPVFLFSLWAAGTVLLLARLLMASRLRRRWLAGARPVADARLHALWQSLAPRRGDFLLLSSSCRVPLTWGRIVLLPEESLTWKEEELRAALEHEFAHLRRRDALFRRAGEIVTALYWPHPLIWPARRLWHRLQEQSCDDTVLRGGGDAAGYASLLCRAARAWQSPAFSGALAMAQPSSLEQRIRTIMNPSADRRPCTSRTATAAALLGIAVLSTAALAQKPAAVPAGPAAPVQAPAVPAAQTMAAGIVIPRLVFSDAGLQESVDYLTRKARELSPDKSPGITLTPQASASKKRITLDLRNVTLWQALALVAKQTDTRLEAGAAIITIKDGAAEPVKAAAGTTELEKKARQWILPRVVFSDAGVSDALDYIRAKAVELDPERKGLSIVLKGNPAKPCNLDLKNVSVWEVLHQITATSGLPGPVIHTAADGSQAVVVNAENPGSSVRN